MTKADYQRAYRNTPRGREVRLAGERKYRESAKGKAQRQFSAKYYQIKTKYGLSRRAFDDMLSRQAGACAICQKIAPLNVDHNHVTGQVRGLLCLRCNSYVLPVVEDRDGLLARAKEYLGDK